MQKFIEEAVSALKEFGVRHYDAIDKIVHKMALRKGKLEQWMSKHPNYEPDNRLIHFPIEHEGKRRDFVISINPRDFLTMGNGSNWSSSTSITGMNKSGVISLMMDDATLVCYTTKVNPSAPQLRRKIMVERVHIESDTFGTFVQGEVLPSKLEDDRWVFLEHLANVICQITGKKFDELRIVQEKNTNKYITGDSHPFYKKEENYQVLITNGKDSHPVLFGGIPVCLECGMFHDGDDLHCCIDDIGEILIVPKEMPADNHGFGSRSLLYH